MKSTTLAKHIERFVEKRRPVVITGAPGGGKTALGGQVAANMGIGFIPFRASLHTREDVTGLPWPVDGKAEFLPLGILPDEQRDGKRGILFIDEIWQADAPLQKALMQLCEPPHAIAGYKLPDGWSIVAAGNRASDRAGVGAINSALANRFAHFELDTDPDSWIAWAAQNDVSAELMAFIRFRPELLHAFDPDSKVNPSPRTWTFADDMRGDCPDAESELETLTAYVGEGPAAEFFGFLKVWRSMPSPDAVLMDPTGTPVPTDAAARYAICGALARKVTEQSADSFVTYLSRMSPEFGVMAIRDAVARDYSLESTRALISWKAANADIYT